MRIVSLILIVISVGSYVAGQLLLKRAMDLSVEQTQGHAKISARFLVGGIGAMTIWFFLSLGLLQQFDLSWLYPFQGLSVILITIAASILLRERLTLRLTVGALVITLGVVLVSLT